MPQKYLKQDNDTPYGNVGDIHGFITNKTVLPQHSPKQQTPEYLFSNHVYIWHVYTRKV